MRRKKTDKKSKEYLDEKKKKKRIARKLQSPVTIVRKNGVTLVDQEIIAPEEY